MQLAIERIMQSFRPSLIAVVLGLALAAPIAAQEAAAPDAAAPQAPAAPEGAPAEAPAPQAAAPDAAPPAPAPGEPAAPAAPASPAAPGGPEIAVTEHGDWDVGCLSGTTNCEMQQVAEDSEGNPVVLMRIVKLPAGQPAESLAIVNTPLGTLLPPGLGFRIDAGEQSALPFEWCVQEGCVVRLGLREPDVTAMKRGVTLTLRVTSIAEPDAPVELTLSLRGFTAAYDSLATPVAEEAPPAGE